jgi:hypothetical protein
MAIGIIVLKSHQLKYWVAHKMSNICIGHFLGHPTYLPFYCRFFYDLKQSPIFEIEYFNASLVAYLVVITYPISDILFFSFAHAIVINLKNLQAQIRSFDFAKMTENFDKFKSIVDYHHEIIDIFQEMNALFTPILWTQFLVTSLSIVMVSFQFTLVWISSYYNFY